jgi:hypothetical protein
MRHFDQFRLSPDQSDPRQMGARESFDRRLPEPGKSNVQFCMSFSLIPARPWRFGSVCFRTGPLASICRSPRAGEISFF